MRNFLADNRVRVVSVCDVDRNHVNRARGIADESYNSNDCRTCQLGVEALIFVE